MTQINADVKRDPETYSIIGAAVEVHGEAICTFKRTFEPQITQMSADKGTKGIKVFICGHLRHLRLNSFSWEPAR
jgi:hypothetical protein